MTKIEREDAVPEEAAFAERMRNLREERGWNQSEMAERMREQGLPYVSQSTVSRIENQTRPVHLAEGLALGKIFNRSIEELIRPSFGLAMLRVRRSTAEQFVEVVNEFDRIAVAAGIARLEAAQQKDWLLREWAEAKYGDQSSPEAQRQLAVAQAALDRVLEFELADEVAAASESANEMFASGTRVRAENGRIETYQQEPF